MKERNLIKEKKKLKRQTKTEMRRISVTKNK